MRYPLLLPDAVPLSVFYQEERCRHDPVPGYKNSVRYILLICNCGISCSKFQVCHPLCQASERNSKVSVRIGKRGKSEVFCIFISQIHTNILKCFYCHNIDGFCDCLPDAREPSEFVRVVIVCFISDRKRCIILHGCQRFPPASSAGA